MYSTSATLSPTYALLYTTGALKYVEASAKTGEGKLCLFSLAPLRLSQLTTAACFIGIGDIFLHIAQRLNEKHQAQPPDTPSMGGRLGDSPDGKHLFGNSIPGRRLSTQPVQPKSGCCG